HEVDAHTIEAGMEVVGERRGEDVDVAQRDQVALGGTGVAKAGKVVALQRRFGTLVAIDDEAAEEEVLLVEVVIDAAGFLIECALPGGGSDEVSAGCIVGGGHKP